MFYTFIIDYNKKESKKKKFELEYAYVEDHIPLVKIEEEKEIEPESSIIIDIF